MSEDIVDILIIGAGASGAAAAWSLADTRMRIMCMDQGDWVSTADYPSNSKNWESANRRQFATSPNQRRLAADYPVNDKDSPIAVLNYNAVGGSTIIYAAHFPRFHPSDFRVRSLDGVADDWPLNYQQLAPYYDENDRMMGVSGLSGDPACPLKQLPLPPLPIGQVGEKLARGFNSLGWHWWPSDSAIISKAHGGRDKCINLSACMTGCPQGAKSTVDITYWPEAIRKGVQLKTNCRVREITVDERGMATGVIYYDGDGKESRQKAHVVMLACNGVGTARLLLNSQSSQFPTGLANRSDQVGRNLMFHPYGYAVGVFEESLSHMGPEGCCILSQEFYETGEERDFKRGYTLKVNRGSGPAVTAIAGNSSGDIPWGADHHRAFAERFDHTVSVSLMIEDLPEPHNRVTLDSELKDADVIPAPKIDYQLSDNSRKMMSHGLEKARTVLAAAGASQIKTTGPARMAGWHLLGTARMGNDPDTSVVNPFGRSHDVRNLFIIDGSIFVTAGAVNPTSTIQALALYIADHMKKNLANLFD
jgi:choline dehydrogenase-like flavoprotein|tara:strand:+ start:3870 stop:5471 length:1602 start_codon:yes stop_codon:yes gene_type:complete